MSLWDLMIGRWVDDWRSRRIVRLLVHCAEAVDGLGGVLPVVCITCENLSRDRAIEVTHVWLEPDLVDSQQRPIVNNLPRRIEAGASFVWTLPLVDALPGPRSAGSVVTGDTR